MPKNGATKWMVGVVIGLIGIFGTLAGTWALYGADIEDNAEDVVELENDGCKPSQIHTTQIAVMQTTQQTIQQDIADIKKEQTIGFTEILNRLPKK